MALRVRSTGERRGSASWAVRRSPAALPLALALAAHAANAANAANTAAPRVCADPARPCAGFKPNDLSFPLPKDGKARPEARSAPFYAVILRSTPPCRIGEPERVAAQALFPANKVFATRFECDGDPGNNVTYSNVKANTGFLAVHAGEDEAGARRFLEKVRALGRFPGANLRRIQVVFVYP